MKPYLHADLHADCRKAINAQPGPRLLAPGLEIGDQVTFADSELPGLWVYTGDSFVRPELWGQREAIDYGVRPTW